MSDSEDDIVITQDGRLKGCRGRVLLAVIVITVLLTLLVVSLFYAMMSGPTPQPVRRAAADTMPELAIWRVDALRGRQPRAAMTGAAPSV